MEIGSGCTVSFSVADLPLKAAALMVTLPGATAVICPPSSTVAMLGSLLDQLMAEADLALTFAVAAMVSPRQRSALVG